MSKSLWLYAARDIHNLHINLQSDALALEFWNSVDSVLTILYYLREQHCKSAKVYLKQNRKLKVKLNPKPK